MYRYIGIVVTVCGSSTCISGDHRNGAGDNSFNSLEYSVTVTGAATVSAAVVAAAA